MKKLFLIVILLLAGCITTYEAQGVVEGLNRGLLLQDPYYQTPAERQMNRNLEDIAHSLRWQTFDSQFRGY